MRLVLCLRHGGAPLTWYVRCQLCIRCGGPEYHLLMKVATGTVVKGTIIVDDPEFKDGTDVFILTREHEEEVRLSPEELAGLEAGIAEADRGEMIPGDEFFARLRRYG